MKIIFIILSVGIFFGCSKDKKEIVKFFPDKIGTKWTYVNRLTNDTIIWEIIGNKNINNYDCFIIRAKSIKSSAYTDYYYAFDYNGLIKVAQTYPQGSFIIKNDSIIVNYTVVTYSNKALYLKYPQTLNSTWDCNSIVLESVDSKIVAVQRPINKTYLKRESITVKFGTFDCIDVRTDSLNSDEYYSSIGLVKAETKMTLNNEIITSTMELIDYK